jgi:hypothetical protein
VRWGDAAAGGGLLGGKDPAGRFLSSLIIHQWCRLIDPPGRAARDDLHDDHLQVNVPFVHQDVDASRVFHKTGACGKVLRFEIVAFVVERCRAGFDRDDGGAGVSGPVNSFRPHFATETKLPARDSN